MEISNKLQAFMDKIGAVSKEHNKLVKDLEKESKAVDKFKCYKDAVGLMSEIIKDLDYEMKDIVRQTKRLDGLKKVLDTRFIKPSRYKEFEHHDIDQLIVVAYGESTEPDCDQFASVIDLDPAFYTDIEMEAISRYRAREFPEDITYRRRKVQAEAVKEANAKAKAIEAKLEAKEVNND